MRARRRFFGRLWLEQDENRKKLQPLLCRTSSSRDRERVSLRGALSSLMLRSRALSAFTRVFDALWRGVSKHEGCTAAPSFETRARPFELRGIFRHARSSG